MYYYNRNSRERIVHTDKCFHIRGVEIDNVGSFETLAEAYQSGYRLCRHCSPIARQYRKESRAMMEFCRGHAASFFFHDRFVGIYTPHSKWRIVPTGETEKIALYHKNTYRSKYDSDSSIPGYHLQNVSEDSLLAYLKYVAEHEDYRMAHPVYIRPEKKEKVPPRKGTKRYRKQQAKAKRLERRKAITNVLDIMDGLHPRSQPSALMA